MSDNTNTIEFCRGDRKIQDLCKSFGDHEVLKGISTTIRKGDVLAIDRTFRLWKIDISAILKPVGDPNERTRSV